MTWTPDDRSEEHDPAWEDLDEPPDDPRERGLPWAPPDVMGGEPETDRLDP